MAVTKKPSIKKSAAGASKSVQAPRVKVAKTSAKKEVKPVEIEKVASSHSLSATVLGADGAPRGKASLPAELFHAKVHKTLMSQSVRVYLANQRVGGASTLTRGEVEGSTRKIYRQKGTGKARHGGIRAPIFVGGGIVFGPRPQDHRLDFPKKMRRIALASALSYQFAEGNVVVLDGLDAIEPKTKSMLHVLAVNKLQTDKLLVVLPKDPKNITRGLRNVQGVTLRPANNLNAYDVLWHKTIVFTKDALPLLKETYSS
jgi:large subunit ribosomal protein L4